MHGNSVTSSAHWSGVLEAKQLLLLCPAASKEAAELFVSLIGGPDSLSCIGTVARNLKMLLTDIAAMDAQVGNQLEPLENLSDQLLLLPDEQKNQIPDFEGSIQSKPRSMYGVISSFPLYAMLSIKTLVRDTRFLAAQAAVTLSVYLIYRYCELESIDKGKYKSRIDGGCRLLRSIGDDDLDLFPGLTGLGEYLDQISAAADPNHRLYSLYLLLRAASKEEIPVERFLTERAKQRHHRTLRMELEHDDGSLVVLVAHEVSDITIEEEQSAVDAGCAPNEVMAAVQYFECVSEDASKIPGMQEKEPSPEALYVRAKRQWAHVIKAAQHLPKRWHRLQTVDREMFFEHIAKLFKKDGEKIEQVPCAELALFLSVVYCLSSPIARVLNLKIVERLGDLPASCEQGEMYYIMHGRFWCLPVMSPRLDCNRVRRIQESGQARPLAKRLMLPDIFNISTFLDGKYEIGRVFRKTEHAYINASKTWLQNLKTEDNSRLSLARIETDLFWTVTEKTGDVTEAVMVFARPHTDADTFLHYTALSDTRLRETYQRVCQTYVQLWGVPARDAQLTELPATEGYVGSPMCPNDASIKSLVLNLRGRLNDAKTRVRSNQFVLDVHNHMSVYTATLLGAATGYRSVRDPLYRIDHFNVSLRRAIISDKSDDADYGTRIAILPNLVCEQLQAYQTHLSALLLHLAILNPQTHSQLKGLLAGKPPEEVIPFLFLLNASLDVVRIREKTIRPYLEDAGYRLPSNTNRHYLRTKGREAGLTAEDLSYVLGHWMAGLEPYGKYAAMGLDEAEMRILPFLDKILSEAGWTVTKGLE